MNVTVVGASRGTGAEVVRAAAAKGHQVRAVSRSGGPSSDGVEQLMLDATDAGALEAVLRGTDAVVVTVGGGGGSPRTDVTRAVIAAMLATGVRRLAVQSSWGAGDSYGSLPFVMKHLVVPLILKQALDDHSRQEQLVADSGLDWTVLRPGGLTSGPPTGHVRLGPATGGPGTLGRVSRTDVAALLLACLDDPSAAGHAFTIAGD